MKIWTTRGYRQVGIYSRPAGLTPRSERIIEEGRLARARPAAGCNSPAAVPDSILPGGDDLDKKTVETKEGDCFPTPRSS
jgi:hypothetical protein